jgi:hypothetical protein
MTRGAALAAVAVAAVIVLATTAGTVGAVRATLPPAAPISASTTTPTGSSVVFAMGHLDQPANTFWELFLRRAGGSSWVLQTPPGVASNGGLVSAASPAGQWTVGFLISALLKFSPLAQSADGGTSWSPGELPSALTAAPDALAVGSTGDVLALVGTGGRRVLQTTGDLDTWNTVTTSGALAGAAPSCGVQQVTAVAFNAAGQPLLGLRCAHRGRIGILVGTATSAWRAIGPSLGSGSSAVTRLVGTPDGVAGLAQVQSGTRASVVAFWGTGSAAPWAGSASLSVPAGWSVEATATGGGSGEGLAVLLGSGETRRVAVVAGPGASWVTLPAAPRGASAVSVIGTEVDTFVVASSKLAVWASGVGAAGWVRAASITVPVPYGSSS